MRLALLFKRFNDRGADLPRALRQADGPELRPTTTEALSGIDLSLVDDAVHPYSLVRRPHKPKISTLIPRTNQYLCEGKIAAGIILPDAHHFFSAP